MNIGLRARVAHNMQPMGFVQPNIQSMGSDEATGLVDADGLPDEPTVE
jgi:hypothetical protein